MLRILKDAMDQYGFNICLWNYGITVVGFVQLPNFYFLFVFDSVDSVTCVLFIVYERSCWIAETCPKVWHGRWRKRARLSRTYLLHVWNSNWISILRFGAGANPTRYLALSLASENPENSHVCHCFEILPTRSIFFPCITRKSKMLFRYKKGCTDVPRVTTNQTFPLIPWSSPV
jgi:hypothetical protein